MAKRKNKCSVCKDDPDRIVGPRCPKCGLRSTSYDEYEEMMSDPPSTTGYE